MYHFNTKMANGWRHIATAFSGVPNELYPPPRHLVRQMAELCPGFCTLWVTKVYMTPANSEIRRGFHMICRYVPEPRTDLEPVQIDVVARDFPWPARKIYESRILDRNVPEHSLYKQMGLAGFPATYAPFSEWWIPQLRRMWWERNRLDQKRMEKTAAAHVDAVMKARQDGIDSASDSAKMALRGRRAAIRQAILDDLEGKPARPEALPNRVYSLPTKPDPILNLVGASA